MSGCGCLMAMATMRMMKQINVVIFVEPGRRMVNRRQTGAIEATQKQRNQRRGGLDGTGAQSTEHRAQNRTQSVGTT